MVCILITVKDVNDLSYKSCSALLSSPTLSTYWLLPVQRSCLRVQFPYFPNVSTLKGKVHEEKFCKVVQYNLLQLIYNYSLVSFTNRDRNFIILRDA